MSIKGAIFDLDGTIIDSMWVWDKIDCDYLTKRNIPVPSDLKSAIEHLGFTEVAQYFKDRFHLNESIDEIKGEWMEMAHKEYSSSIILKPGIKMFLNTLKKANIKLALATSNCHYLLEPVLKRHDLYDLFDSITLTDEAARGKEHPDVYLLACSRLGLSPDECVVFEDILPAMKGAKKAGMKVVGINDSYNDCSHDDVANIVDHYIDDYVNFKI